MQQAARFLRLTRGRGERPHGTVPGNSGQPPASKSLSSRSIERVALAMRPPPVDSSVRRRLRLQTAAWRSLTIRAVAA